MQAPPQIRRTSSLGNRVRRGVSSDPERHLARTLSDPYVNPLEAWRDERSRARNLEKPLQLGPLNYDTPDEKTDEEDVVDDRALESIHAPDEQPKAKAWDSGSILLRPQSVKSERVVQQTYIYIVGCAKDGAKIELIIGPPESPDFKDVGVAEVTLLSEGTRVCVPESNTYRLFNNSNSRTAVIFWASLHDNCVQEGGEMIIKNEGKEGKGEKGGKDEGGTGTPTSVDSGPSTDDTAQSASPSGDHAPVLPVDSSPPSTPAT